MQGVWNIQQRSHHINYLKLLAIHIVLHAFLLLIQGKVVWVRTDILTAKYYLQKQGGTHSLSLSVLACAIWYWVLLHHINLLTKYLGC